MIKAKYSFTYRGRHGAFFVFRAPLWNTRRRKALDALTFRNAVFNWLVINTRYGLDATLGTTATSGFGELWPSGKTGAYLALALRRPIDIARFDEIYPLRGIDPTMVVQQSAVAA